MSQQQRADRLRFTVSGIDQLSNIKFPTQLRLSPVDIGEISDVAKSSGGEFLDLGSLRTSKLEEFYKQNVAKERFRTALRGLVRPGYDDDYAVNRYDIEYGTWGYEQFTRTLTRLNIEPGSLDEQNLKGALLHDPNYSFYSALVDPILWPRMIDPSLLSAPRLIFDVGCGNGQLLDFLAKTIEVPKCRLRGIDISKASTELLKAKGFSVACGSLPQLIENGTPMFIENSSLGVIFLSYFVDRDADQKGTFNAAIQKLDNNGVIVLEGLFPVCACDSLGGVYAAGDTTITRGKSAADDIKRIVDYLGERSADTLKLTKIITAERLVYSLDGFEILPSVFICLRRGV